jgi:hypothetical protein
MRVHITLREDLVRELDRRIEEHAWDADAAQWVRDQRGAEARRVR